MGTAFQECTSVVIDDNAIDYLGCMYKVFGTQLPFIKVPPSTRITFYAAGRRYRLLAFYNGNFIEITSYNSTGSERTVTTTPETRAVSLSMQAASDLKNVYVKNTDTGEYYFNGAEYTD